MYNNQRINNLITSITNTDMNKKDDHKQNSLLPIINYSKDKTFLQNFQNMLEYDHNKKIVKNDRNIEICMRFLDLAFTYHDTNLLEFVIKMETVNLNELCNIAMTKESLDMISANILDIYNIFPKDHSVICHTLVEKIVDNNHNEFLNTLITHRSDNLSFYTIIKLIELNQITIMEFLLKNEKLNPSDYKKYYEHAAISNNVEILKLIFKYTDVDPSFDKNLVLAISSIRNYDKIAKEIIEHPKFCTYCDDDVLVFTLKHSNLDTVKVLINIFGIHINAHNLIKLAIDGRDCDVAHFVFDYSRQHLENVNMNELIKATIDNNMIKMCLTLIEHCGINNDLFEYCALYGSCNFVNIFIKRYTISDECMEALIVKTINKDNPNFIEILIKNKVPLMDMKNVVYCAITKRKSHIVRMIMESKLKVSVSENMIIRAINMRESSIIESLLKRYKSVSENMIIRAINMRESSIIESLLKRYKGDCTQFVQRAIDTKETSIIKFFINHMDHWLLKGIMPEFQKDLDISTLRVFPNYHHPFEQCIVSFLNDACAMKDYGSIDMLLYEFDCISYRTRLLDIAIKNDNLLLIESLLNNDSIKQNCVPIWLIMQCVINYNSRLLKIILDIFPTLCVSRKTTHKLLNISLDHLDDDVIELLLERKEIYDMLSRLFIKDLSRTTVSARVLQMAINKYEKKINISCDRIELEK